MDPNQPIQTFEIPRTPPHANISQSVGSTSPKQKNNSPIASRTRSKSTDRLNNSDTRNTLAEISIFENPNLTKELQIKLTRLSDNILFESFKHSFSDSFGDHSEDITMAEITYADLINAIPQFDGNEKELESFINSCDIYHTHLTEGQQNMFLAIIISKLKGEALSKILPISEITTWQQLKTKLEEKLRKPYSFEYAQEKLVSLTQGKNENIEILARESKLHWIS